MTKKAWRAFSFIFQGRSNIRENRLSVKFLYVCYHTSTIIYTACMHIFNEPSALRLEVAIAPVNFRMFFCMKPECHGKSNRRSVLTRKTEVAKLQSHVTISSMGRCREWFWGIYCHAHKSATSTVAHVDVVRPHFLPRPSSHSFIPSPLFIRCAGMCKHSAMTAARIDTLEKKNNATNINL